MPLMRAAGAPTGAAQGGMTGTALRAYVSFGGPGTSSNGPRKDEGFHDVKYIEMGSTTNWSEVTRGENVKTQFGGLVTVMELKETHPILFVASLKKDIFDKVIARIDRQDGKAVLLVTMENCRIQSYQITGDSEGVLSQQVCWVADKIISKHEEPNKEAEYQFSKANSYAPAKNPWS